MKCTLKIKNSDKEEVLGLLTDAIEYKQKKNGVVYGWYYTKKIAMDDVANANKKLEKEGRKLDTELINGWEVDDFMNMF